jgi:2,3-diaminopropionate biosynthesis protein SbnA
MIVERPDQYLGPDIFARLDNILHRRLAVKCEGFNFGWSIKLRSALSMIEAAERDGCIAPGATIVESSSGNLGVALSVIAASRSMNFICVTDPNCSRQNRALMRVTGAVVEIVQTKDENGSYLGARKQRVQQLCERNRNHVWLNQYENSANAQAHHDTTAVSIDCEFPDLDALFIGVGTGGTLMGCLDYFRERGKATRIIAVDSVGSVNFNGSPAPRYIAGLGSSQPMTLIKEDEVDGIEWVHERDAVLMCRKLARAGFVLGGSSGTVIQGAKTWLARNDPDRRLNAVAVAPDFGPSYLETVYDDAWCESHFPDFLAALDDSRGDRGLGGRRD